MALASSAGAPPPRRSWALPEQRGWAHFWAAWVAGPAGRLQRQQGLHQLCHWNEVPSCLWRSSRRRTTLGGAQPPAQPLAGVPGPAACTPQSVAALSWQARAAGRQPAISRAQRVRIYLALPATAATQQPPKSQPTRPVTQPLPLPHAHPLAVLRLLPPRAAGPAAAPPLWQSPTG